jgi:hypothetical protein
MDAISRTGRTAMNITKRSVAALELRAQRYIAWDAALSGFGVRVEASGRKTFICRYRSGGVRRQYTIGRYGVLTPEEARAEARRVLGAVVLGDDPAGVRQEDRKRSGSPIWWMLFSRTMVRS